MANRRPKRPSQSSHHSARNSGGGSDWGKRTSGSSGRENLRGGKLRIIAGTHRGRIIAYRGDPITRPMKDRTREALFSRLGGLFDRGIAIDLFAGTGVLGLESLSRGANQAWLLEMDPTAASDIRTTAKQLSLEQMANVRCGDSFLLAPTVIKQIQLQNATASPPIPWIVFVCPPYAMWSQQPVELKTLLDLFASQAPVGSLLAVELAEDTPQDILPNSLEWDVRLYRPAQVAIAEK